MRNYSVLITEYRQKTVYVRADSAAEAVEDAMRIWKSSFFELDATNFPGVKISAIDDDRNMTILHSDCNGNEYEETKEV